MRIFQIITRSDLGGAQSVLINLANDLCMNHEVIVIAGDGDGKMWNELDKHIKCIYLKQLKRQLSPVNDFFILLSLLYLKWKYRPDIVHLHSSKAATIGRLVFPAKKTVYTVHGFDSIRIAYRKFLFLEKYLQRCCNAIVPVSRYDKKNLREEGITRHVSVVYNGIYIPESLNQMPFHFVGEFQAKVLCIARLSPPKRYDLFLKVAVLLPQFAFIWIGNQSEIKTNIPKNVFFMGSLSNAGAYNEYADLFMLPSDYEGLPMVIIEAMSFGKPIVASDVGGISEIVINGENGYVVENAPESFAEKIQYILNNKGVYEKFSENSYRMFKEKLTADKMVGEYLKIYHFLLEE